jgi:hypothetical protein
MKNQESVGRSQESDLRLEATREKEWRRRLYCFR